jgi:hypothetical protein
VLTLIDEGKHYFRQHGLLKSLVTRGATMPRFLQSWFSPLFVGVVIVQGIHVIEHIIQLTQVYVMGVPDDDALGLLGYVFEFHDTEEWLHLVFNITYLLALGLLVLPLRRLVPYQVPAWAFGAFVIGAVGLESWHVVEHGVIITNVIQNSGCPCPGIGDAALGVTDTVLHFFYNAVAYSATLIPYWYVTRGQPRLSPSMS